MAWWTNFNLLVRTRDTNVGIVYRMGFLNVSRDGEYTFWTKSDDGSKLFLDNFPLQIHKRIIVPVPPPKFFESDQPIGDENEGQSIEVEGVVTRINEVLGGMCLELTSGAGIKYLKILDIKHGDLERLLLGVQSTNQVRWNLRGCKCSGWKDCDFAVGA